MYLITGATGNTGKPLTLELLKAGKRVKIISRSREKAKELTDKGAELFIGTWSDAVLLSRALEEVTAVWAMIPPDVHSVDFYAFQRNFVDAMASAIMISDVKYVATLSSVGAHLDSGSGAILGLRYMEQKFNEIFGLNTLHLRCSYFMENVIRLIYTLKYYNIFGSPVKPDLKMSMIAAKDISRYAVKRLLALDFTGHNIQNLLGERDITYNEVAKILGKAIGKPDITYTQTSEDFFKKSLIQGMGATENAAEKIIENLKKLNESNIYTEAKRSPESTTPTSIEEFADIFASVYKMK